MKAARLILVLALCLASQPATAQTLKEEAAAERAMSEGNALAQSGRWAEAGERYLAALASQPHSPEITMALASASEQQRQAHKALLWYRRTLVVFHEPPEPIRQDVCARIDRLWQWAAKRLRADLAIAAEAILATRDAIIAAGPPEDGTIEQALRVLAPAEFSLGQAYAPPAAEPAWNARLAEVRLNRAIDQAWLELAVHPVWGALDQALAHLQDETRPLPERALAAANVGRMRAFLHGRIHSLAQATDEAGRGC